VLRIVLIGCGNWGKNYIQAVKDTGLASITSIITPTLMQATNLQAFPSEQLSNEIPITWADIPFKLDLLSQVDAAIVATHPPLTEQYAILLLENGISVMVEKPFTFTRKALTRVSSILAKSKGSLTFLINHQHIFSKAAEHITEYISSTDHVVYSSRAGGQGPMRAYPPMWDYGPHDLALLLYFTKRSFRVTNFLRTGIKSGLKETIILRSEAGDMADITVWNHRPPKTHLVKLKTADHSILYDDFNQEARVQVNCFVPKLDYVPPLTLSVNAFLSSVIRGGSNEDPRFGTEIAEAYTDLLAPFVPITN